MNKKKHFKRVIAFIFFLTLILAVGPLVANATTSANVNRSVRTGRNANNRPWIEATLTVASSGRTHNVSGIGAQGNLSSGAATNWAWQNNFGSGFPGGSSTTSTRLTAPATTTSSGWGAFMYIRVGDANWRFLSNMQVRF